MAYDEGLAQRMRDQMADFPGVVEKKMFGGIGFLVNGNMACGVNKDYLIVRLDHEQYEEAMKKPSVKSFDMTGRPMKGWIMVSPGGYKTEEELKDWIQQGMAFASSLPEK
jgi:TfoX/Sxy family transcriptional regulator of competence genes